jgi:hypothetical protein
MALRPLALQHAMNPKPIQSRFLNDDDLEGLPGPRKRALLDLPGLEKTFAAFVPRVSCRRPKVLGLG